MLADAYGDIVLEMDLGVCGRCKICGSTTGKFVLTLDGHEKTAQTVDDDTCRCFRTRSSITGECSQTPAGHEVVPPLVELFARKYRCGMTGG